MNVSPVLALITSTLLVSATSVLAADSLSFSGNLVIPPCVVNNNNQIATGWGNVEIQTLDKLNDPIDEKKLTIPVSCPYYWGTPKMKLKGNGSKSGNPGGLATSKDTEGLEILIGQSKQGDWVALNTNVTVINSALQGTGKDKNLTLYAYLARYKDIDLLSAGAFNATAGLELTYE